MRGLWTCLSSQLKHCHYRMRTRQAAQEFLTRMHSVESPQGLTHAFRTRMHGVDPQGHMVAVHK